MTLVVAEGRLQSAYIVPGLCRLSSDMVKLVFKMLELSLKTPKLPCPAFSLRGLGWNLAQEAPR